MTTLYQNAIVVREVFAMSAPDVRSNPPLTIPANTSVQVEQHAYNTPTGSYRKINGGTYTTKYVDHQALRFVDYLEA